ncbi:STAS domain-containing protein [Parachlamydia sp. AcF125]|uniref:STAS domain-containing protein n=1 Tax=Parachlamydia sp. AcF125 TaxID=2795736 RepID=UPI001BCA1643|nr:STAS domain-containing protein [Parachlamydia sp. AcF125]MBS4168504.1 putative anti-sigma factor antagonist BtrV [Parachlamydia sp. AcF125]
MALMGGFIEISEEQEQGILIFHLKGRLDPISSVKAEEKILEKIKEGSSKLLMDFSQVTYLSSAGMRMLLSTSKKLKALSGKLVLCCVTSNVMDVLKMSGFDHIFVIATSKEQALSILH